MGHNFRKDKDGIESDVKTRIEDGTEMEMMKGANEGRGLEEAEKVVESEIDEEKIELKTDIFDKVVIKAKMEQELIVEDVIERNKNQNWN